MISFLLFRAVKWHNKVPVTCFKQWTEHRFQSQGKLQLPINSTHFFHASSANFYQALWAVLFWNHTLCWPSGFCQQCCFLCNKVNSAIESSIENANFQRHWCIASNISMEIVYWLFVSFRFCFYPQTGTSVSGLGPVSSRFVLAIRSIDPKWTSFLLVRKVLCEISYIFTRLTHLPRTAFFIETVSSTEEV